jgi:hypothetical protein
MSVAVKIMEINEKVIGIDADGVIVEVHGGVTGIQVSDVVEGHLLNNDEDPSDFYVDAFRIIPSEELAKLGYLFDTAMYDNQAR